MTIVIIILVLIAFFAIVISVNNKQMKEAGFEQKDFISSMKFMSDHPLITKQQICNVCVKEKVLHIMTVGYKKLGEIDGGSIKTIIVEDESTFEKKVTLARLALVGIFAFGIKKKKKNEIAYLTISWNDDRFDYSTIFEFEGVGSLHKANLVKSKIIMRIK